MDLHVNKNNSADQIKLKLVNKSSLKQKTHQNVNTVMCQSYDDEHDDLLHNQVTEVSNQSPIVDNFQKCVYLEFKYHLVENYSRECPHTAVYL